MGIIPETTTRHSDSLGPPAAVLRRVAIDRGGARVLEVEHLDITPGYTAIVGSNGSGKTTLLHAIAGLLSPTVGAVDTANATIAYVLQSQRGSEHLLVTGREVVALARRRHGLFGRLDRDDRDAIERAMERLDVADLAHRHLAEMSGGQRQRIFIAQGLAQDADVLLLDEPVAGLDLASEQTIRSAIDDECTRNRAVVVATHDLEEAGRADRVVMLNRTVVAQGPPSEVLRAEHLRAAYHGRVLEVGDGLVVDDGVHHDHPHEAVVPSRSQE